MALRPVFIPVLSGAPGVKIEMVSFQWLPGFAPSQKRKNVVTLHQAMQTAFGGHAPLEVSSKSPVAWGVRLSAFSLGIESTRSGRFVCVESLYQCSKVFADAGPFPQGYALPAMDARELVKPHAAKPVKAFDLHGVRWPITPSRAFYDWIYCQALHRHPELIAELSGFTCFTDIEFNPKRSINCQAYAVALYQSLVACGQLQKALASQADFLSIHPRESVCLEPRRKTSNGERRVPTRKSSRPRRGSPPQPAPMTLFDQAMPSQE
jgi:hypothetical protein